MIEALLTLVVVIVAGIALAIESVNSTEQQFKIVKRFTGVAVLVALTATLGGII